jgi:hypothetical protein
MGGQCRATPNHIVLQHNTISMLLPVSGTLCLDDAWQELCTGE